jgi:hypothetical protein
MIGNTTLYHLINDSLMPELMATTGENVFRKIWREWNSEWSRTEASLYNPIKAFKLNGLKLQRDLEDEWETIVPIAVNQKENPPLKKLFDFFPSQYRLRVLLGLFWQILHFQYHDLFTQIRAEASHRHQQYILMHYLMDLEQFMDDNEKKKLADSDAVIRLAFHYLLIFFWLKYENSYQDLIHFKSMRNFKEDLLFNLKNTELQTGKLQEYLLEQLKDSPVLSQEEFEKMAPVEIMAGLKEDIDEIKDGMKHLGQPLEMEKDVYLQPKEVKEVFGIPQSSLANYRKEGKLKKYKFMFNRYEYSRKELVLFVKNQSVRKVNT